MTSIPITSNSTSTSGISCYPFIQIANSHVIANKALQQSTNSNNTQNVNNNNSYVDYTESSAPFFDAANNPNLTSHSYPQPPAPQHAKTVAADSDFFTQYYNHNYQHIQYHKNDTASHGNTSLTNNFYPTPSLPHHSYNYPLSGSNYALTNKTNTDLSDALDRSTSMTSSGLNRYETTAFTPSMCGLDFTNNLSYGGGIKNETDFKKINNKGCNLMEYYGEKAGSIENMTGNGHETIGQMLNHQQDTNSNNNSKFKTKLNPSTRNASSSNNSKHSLFRFYCIYHSADPFLLKIF